MLTVSYLIADEAYISAGAEDDATDDFYWHDGSTRIEVNSQDGQVRIGVMAGDAGRSEDVGLYFSPSRARELIEALEAAAKEAEVGVSA